MSDQKGSPVEPGESVDVAVEPQPIHDKAGPEAQRSEIEEKPATADEALKKEEQLIELAVKHGGDHHEALERDLREHVKGLDKSRRSLQTDLVKAKARANQLAKDLEEAQKNYRSQAAANAKLQKEITELHVTEPMITALLEMDPIGDTPEARRETAHLLCKEHRKLLNWDNDKQKVVIRIDGDDAPETIADLARQIKTAKPHFFRQQLTHSAIPPRVGVLPATQQWSIEDAVKATTPQRR